MASPTSRSARSTRTCSWHLADGVAAMLPNATFEWFEDAGHVCQNDEPAHYNQVALRFLFGV
jgi:pimeloyl-ACP methyl ester carboxylesterase